MSFTVHSETQEFESKAISPYREVGAYEALWDRRGASFAQIASLFRRKPDAIPSDFVEPATALQYASEALSKLQAANVERFGVRVHGAGEYPMKLRDADHPIELLYFKGWWDLVETTCVSVVGTREPTPEGKARAAKLVRHLVEDDITVVSGLARGIDTVVHNTAISSGGRTIAVIGTPLSFSYPKENAQLQQFIGERFLLISQVPIVRYSKQSPRGNRIFFVERNVTMSALTLATIIVEAGETSGTRVQARAALRQGRKVFILDSCFRNPKLSWPKKFQEMGAIRVKEYEDIKSRLDYKANPN